jgi:hypothetical protein
LPVQREFKVETEFGELQEPSANMPQLPVGVPKEANCTPEMTCPGNGHEREAVSHSAIGPIHTSPVRE